MSIQKIHQRCKTTSIMHISSTAPLALGTVKLSRDSTRHVATTFLSNSSGDGLQHLPAVTQIPSRMKSAHQV